MADLEFREGEPGADPRGTCSWLRVPAHLEARRTGVDSSRGWKLLKIKEKLDKQRGLLLSSVGTRRAPVRGAPGRAGPRGPGRISEKEDLFDSSNADQRSEP